MSLQEAVVPVGVYVGPGEELEADGWEPVPVPYPSWWFAEAPRPAPIHLPAPAPQTVETQSLAGPQIDLFPEVARKGVEAASRWDPLLKSEVYSAQRQLVGAGVPDDTIVRVALDALFEAGGRLPPASLAKRVGVPVRSMHGMIAGLQRLLNVDGYPVLRFSDGTEYVELDGGLFVELFELKP